MVSKFGISNFRVLFLGSMLNFGKGMVPPTFRYLGPKISLNTLTCLCIYICFTYICFYVYIYMFCYVYIYIHTFMYLCIDTYIYIYIDIYLHFHIHTYLDVYIYIAYDLIHNVHVCLYFNCMYVKNHPNSWLIHSGTSPWIGLHRARQRYNCAARNAFPDKKCKEVNSKGKVYQHIPPIYIRVGKKWLFWGQYMG